MSSNKSLANQASFVVPPSNGKVIVQVVDKHIQMCYLVLVLLEVCLAASKVLYWCRGGRSKLDNQSGLEHNFHSEFLPMLRGLSRLFLKICSRQLGLWIAAEFEGGLARFILSALLLKLKSC